MSTRSGQKTVDNNNEQKHVLGRSANACANKWLAERRGRQVRVMYNGHSTFVGELAEFDLYAFRLLRGDGRELLVFKGPGVAIEEV